MRHRFLDAWTLQSDLYKLDIKKKENTKIKIHFLILTSKSDIFCNWRLQNVELPGKYFQPLVFNYLMQILFKRWYVYACVCLCVCVCVCVIEPTKKYEKIF